MDVLVMLEEHPDASPVLAHVNSAPGPVASGRSRRDVVTLYGAPTAESLALALAAAVETQRATDEHSGTIRHLGIWPERGAVGDAAWRDSVTGQLMTLDLAVPLERLRETSARLLGECGQMLRRLVAGLAMPDWPEGARRAIGFSMTPVADVTAAARLAVDSLLDSLREADGFAFDADGGD
jgi:hypothetical protein